MEENNNIEKKGNLNVILITIIVVLVLMLGGLSYYTFFVREDTKINNNKTTDNNANKEEIDDNKATETDDEKTTDEEVEDGYTTLFKNEGDYNFTKNPTKEDLVVEAVLGKVEKNINDMTKEEWQQFILTRAVVFTEYKEIEASKDCNSISSEEETKKYMACLLGMTSEEISKADITIFESVFGGSTGYMSYDLENIKKQITETYGSYGNIFDKNISFVSSKLGSSIFYDKNIDKVFLHYASAPSFGISGRYIVNKTPSTNSYVIEYFDYTVLEELRDVNDKVIATVDDIDNIEKLIEDNIDKFPKKKVTFKLVNGVYKYDSEKDV